MTVFVERAHGITTNRVYSLAGGVLSIAVMLITVPLCLHQVGRARYGVLAVIWLILGNFSIFDMGLSRATSNLTAKLSDGKAEDRQTFRAKTWPMPAST